MAKARMDLSTFVGKLLEEQDGDVLREGVGVLAQALMDTEVTALVGAERHERSDERTAHLRPVARRKLTQLNRVRALRDLAVPPGNRLEPLHGNRSGQVQYPDQRAGTGCVFAGRTGMRTRSRSLTTTERPARRPLVSRRLPAMIRPVRLTRMATSHMHHSLASVVFATALLLASSIAFAQAPATSHAHPPRIYTTERLAGAPPSIDGRLDDEAWKQGEWAGDYVQQLPVEGGKASQKTELKILYDDKNIYFAIRAYDDMSKITKYPARRDSITGDVVGVCFDSLFDKRSGFEFDLNSAGTKIDLVLTNEGWDTTWDAVWDGKVAYEADAWTAEFRIPLSQLRYSPQDVQVWGIHSWRWIDRLQEESQFNLIPRSGTGRLNNFGELHGIHGLTQHRRFELLPYLLGEVKSLPDEAGNPYVGSADGKASAGLDAKIGLSSNFTLDATINPDFGQVEADPSVVNLTTYETFYEEQRPFFLEGKRIFTLGLPGSAIAGNESGTLQGDQVFYSRRIGAPPSVRPVLSEGAFLEMPGETSIITAAKVTGKTENGLSVGFLQSVTDNEQANVWVNGGERRGAGRPDDELRGGPCPEGLGQGQYVRGGHVHVHAPVAARRGRAPRVAGRCVHGGRGRHALLQEPLLRDRGQGLLQPRQRGRARDSRASNQPRALLPTSRRGSPRRRPRRDVAVRMGRHRARGALRQQQVAVV